MFSEKRIKIYQRKIGRKLLIAPRQKFKFSENWFQKISSAAGIYGVFERNKLIYIGESGSLRARMRDLGRTVNHQFRRSLGEYKFSDESGFKVASSKKKFPPLIEEKLNKWMEQNLKVAVVSISLGRKEFEEHVCKLHKPIFNKKVQRECK